MVGIAFLFLCLRGWVRFIRRTRINLSDIFVSFAWVGFVADSVGHTILVHLGLELTPSKQTTVDVNADPTKLVQVYKVFSVKGTGRLFLFLELSSMHFRVGFETN
jgi:hypothetical protein